MLYKKEGFPEEGEIVVCTVTSVQYHSVFAKLNEYDKTGMIHISEISPGRIRNIRDYVTEGKVIICKVLRVRREREQIDLSLRRVNENQRKQKITQMKQEQIAEKIIEFVAKELGMKTEELFEAIEKQIFAEHETIYDAFEQVLEENNYLEQLGIPKQYAEPLTKVILERIKPPQVIIKRELTIHSYNPLGLSLIKKALEKHEKKVQIIYEGGGKYLLELIASNYKEGEKLMQEVLTPLEKELKAISQTTFTITQEK